MDGLDAHVGIARVDGGSKIGMYCNVWPEGRASILFEPDVSDLLYYVISDGTLTDSSDA